jgi:two-component sensor histidine kinase
VRWAVLDIGGGTPLLTLEWRETGGPAVSPPAQTGFGSRLMKSSVKQDLAGEVALEFNPAGLVCRIEAPLQSIPEREATLGF